MLDPIFHPGLLFPRHEKDCPAGRLEHISENPLGNQKAVRLVTACPIISALPANVACSRACSPVSADHDSGSGADRPSMAF